MRHSLSLFLGDMLIQTVTCVQWCAHLVSGLPLLLQFNLITIQIMQLSPVNTSLDKVQ